MNVFEDIKTGLEQAIEYERSLKKKKAKMSDEEIATRMQLHWAKAHELYPASRIVGLFLQGSQNYYMEDEESDVDTKLIILPSFGDFVANTSPISTTIVLPNNEHMDAKDIRLYFQTVRKGNLNFVEIFYSRVFILNPEYKDLWDRLINIREEIGYMNPCATLSAMLGMAAEKRHALTHIYPSRAEIIEKFGGYDPKQLHHLIRVTDFIEDFISGYYARQASKTGSNPAYYGQAVRREYQRRDDNRRLLEIKRQGVGSLERAEKIADEYFAEAKEVVERAKVEIPKGEQTIAWTIMLEVEMEMIRRNLKKEIMEDDRKY